MSTKVLIRGGTVLTLGGRTSNLAQADVLVEDGRISEVATGLRARDAEVVDATDGIIMPGFVDTHRHLWKSLFRNFGETLESGGSPPSPQLYGPHYQAEDLYAATLIGLLGAAEAGITTVVDWADLPGGSEHVEAALQAHADAGIRTVFALAAAEWSNEPKPSRTEDVSIGGPLTTHAFGSPEPSRSASIEDDWARARSRGLRIHAHAGTDPVNVGAIAELGDRGLLGDDLTLVHCSLLDAADLEAISQARAGVALAPASEMAIGLGAPPIQDLIDRGIRPGLGVDQEALAPGDIFAAMRSINSVQHATLFDLKLSGKGSIPNLLTTRDVIRYATIDGASAVGLGETTGSLEVGKQADILVLRTDRPNIHPVNDPIGAVVWGMDTSNVEWVFAGGTALVRAGQLVFDTERARQLAVSAQRRVAAAAGLMVSAELGS